MYLIDTRKYDDSFLLAKILEKVDFTDGETKKLFKHFEISTVDTVGVVAKNETTTEVVRCKDCIHNSLNRRSGNVYCDLGIGLFQLNDFCSRGKRKNETD